MWLSLIPLPLRSNSVPQGAGQADVIQPSGVRRLTVTRSFVQQIFFECLLRPRRMPGAGGTGSVVGLLTEPTGTRRVINTHREGTRGPSLAVGMGCHRRVLSCDITVPLTSLRCQVYSIECGVCTGGSMSVSVCVWLPPSVTPTDTGSCPHRRQVSDLELHVSAVTWHAAFPVRLLSPSTVL